MKNKAVNLGDIKNTLSKGAFLSAKIYSDVTGNLCSCGDKFTGRGHLCDYDFPECPSCKETPTLYRINARIEDGNGTKKTVTIRHDQSGSKLTDIGFVLACLGTIKQEIVNGEFDFRKYDSKASKESFLFENFTIKYLEHYERAYIREEIKLGGLRSKKSAIKNHLLPFFRGVSICKISSPSIEAFKDIYTKKLRARDKALSELKTMLKWAHKNEMIDKIPHFDKIPRAKQRKEIPRMETVLKVISNVDSYYQEAFTILAIYPIRPCALRCLRWKDIDFKNNTMTIQRHLSGLDEMDGRKSLSPEHPKSKLVYPLTPKALEIFKSKPFAIDKDLLIFPSKQRYDIFMSHNALPKAWKKACLKSEIEPFDSYEIKHARITEITELSNGNMVEVMEATGHTNINTVMRYSKSKTDLSKIFN